MANRFYMETFLAAVGQLARSRALDAQFIRLQQAFDALTAELDGIELGSVNRFTELADAPATLVGLENYLLTVNAAGTAIVGVAPGYIRLTSATSSRDATLADMGSLMVADSATAMAITLPANTDVAIPVGFTLIIVQWGAGRVTVQGAGSVTVRAAGSIFTTRAQFSQVTCIKIAEDEWLIGGDLGA